MTCAHHSQKQLADRPFQVKRSAWMVTYCQRCGEVLFVAHNPHRNETLIDQVEEHDTMNVSEIADILDAHQERLREGYRLRLDTQPELRVYVVGPGGDVGPGAPILKTDTAEQIDLVARMLTRHADAVRL